MYSVSFTCSCSPKETPDAEEGKRYFRYENHFPFLFCLLQFFQSSWRIAEQTRHVLLLDFAFLLCIEDQCIVFLFAAPKVKKVPTPKKKKNPNLNLEPNLDIRVMNKDPFTEME